MGLVNGGWKDGVGVESVVKDQTTMHFSSQDSNQSHRVARDCLLYFLLECSGKALETCFKQKGGMVLRLEAQPYKAWLISTVQDL